MAEEFAAVGALAKSAGATVAATARRPAVTGLTFEWDRRKNASNRRKHGVPFAEAATAFADPHSVTITDPDHSLEEERFLLIGSTGLERLVVVVYTERSNNIRLISARLATPLERQTYDQAPP